VSAPRPIAASGLRIHVPADSPAAVARLLAKAARRRVKRVKRFRRDDVTKLGRKP
jgi:hypothetical protein